MRFPPECPPRQRSLAACATLFPLLILGACGGGDTGAPAQDGRYAATVSTSAQAGLLPAEGHPPPTDAELAAAAAARAGISLSAPTPPADGVQLEGGLASATVGETIRLASTWTALVPATINAAPYWPVWYGNGKPVDGVNCLLNGNWHKHALISIYNNGKRLGFPDGIGRVHAGCYHAYEMHVHDVTGIVHMESDTPKQFKLGQWFSLWKQPLSRTNVAGLAGPVRFYIIDNATITRYDGDPYQIQLLPHREVLIVTGTPMSVAPKYQWPAGI
jgi:hypothetical protein